MNMILHNHMDADLRKGDTLINSQHKDENNNLMLFDRVIANPPFSQDGWWSVMAGMPALSLHFISCACINGNHISGHDTLKIGILNAKSP
ncbi:MAG: hypothetical protein NVS9B7_01540 [Flavisolibacter sp.]